MRKSLKQQIDPIKQLNLGAQRNTNMLDETESKCKNKTDTHRKGTQQSVLISNV